MARAATQARLPVPGACTVHGVSGKFLAALATAHCDNQIEHDPQGNDTDWNEQHRKLYRHHWVVYAETAVGGPAQVLEYLSRYTHRTAISNERIRSVTPDAVAVTVRADD